MRVRVGMDFPASNIQSLPESDSHGRLCHAQKTPHGCFSKSWMCLSHWIHRLCVASQRFSSFRMRLLDLQRAKGCREYVNISCIRTFKCSRPQQTRRFACIACADGTQNSNEIFHRRPSIPGLHRLDIYMMRTFVLEWFWRGGFRGSSWY